MSDVLSSPAPAADPYAAYSPVMRQYLKMKEEVPGAILLYRLGDFYETFEDDAVRINRLIGLTLTKRGTVNGRPVPMAGLPALTLEQYLARLVRLGESVAICEQIGDPSDARSGMMERRIVRVVTPGTLTDNALLADKSDSILLALTPGMLRTGTVALVWLTLTNGDFRAIEIPAGELAGELVRIEPSEILTNERGAALVRSLGCPQTLTELPEWHFDAQRGQEVLKHRFGLDNLQAWGLEGQNTILCSVNAILGYVEQTQRETPPYIAPLTIETESSHIGLDAASRRNLEITQSLRNDDGPTLFSVIDRCQSAMGSRLLKHWLHHPLRSTAEVTQRHSAVAELLTEEGAGQPLRQLLAKIPDIERMAGRIALRSLRPKEAAALRDALPELERLAAQLGQCSCALLRRLGTDCRVEASLHARLSTLLLDEPSALLRDGDVIRSSASDELARLRQMRDNAGQYLCELEAREKERTGIASLRVEYNRVAGYYIEVPHGQTQNVPDDYRRRQTLKNVERYTIDELKEYENQALSARERAAQIERTLWDGLLSELAGWVEGLLAAARAAAACDVLCAFALHAQQARWVQPVLDQQPGLDVQGARHPVVEHMLDHYVPNNCRLVPGRRLLVITGPNMGGKSTYMRSIALIVLLAYAGSFVPAQSARLGPVDKILTRIGASDDLARGRSTFMVEMTEAAAILHQATENSLVLMDEIGRGTSTFDGLSLAGAIAHELVSVTRSWTLFATHYFELTQLGHDCPEVANVHVCAEQSTQGVVFLHDVREGPASQSYGIAVAGLAGVPAGVIRRARQLLSRLESRAAESGPQLDLFGALLTPLPESDGADTERCEKLTEYVHEVAQLDVDALSPREALAVLYELRQAADKLS